MPQQDKTEINTAAIKVCHVGAKKDCSEAALVKVLDVAGSQSWCLNRTRQMSTLLPKLFS